MNFHTFCKGLRELTLLGVGFGTSISNWVITMDALEPFSCNPKTVQDPVPFDHLRWKSEGDGALDIKLRVTLISQLSTLTDSLKLLATAFTDLLWVRIQGKRSATSSRQATSSTSGGPLTNSLPTMHPPVAVCGLEISSEQGPSLETYA